MQLESKCALEGVRFVYTPPHGEGKGSACFGKRLARICSPLGIRHPCPRLIHTIHYMPTHSRSLT